MSKKVLVAYGDLHGPTVVRAAELVLHAVAPDLEILHGMMGAEAYVNYAYALPPETVSLITDSDAILCGPVNMKGISERDPIASIKKQIGLYLEHREFFTLSEYLGRENVNVEVMNPTPENTLNVFETESLDGITSEQYTDVEAMSKFFTKAMTMAMTNGKDLVRLVLERDFYPVKQRSVRMEFHAAPAAKSIRKEDMSTSEALFQLARDPSNLGCVMCDIQSAPCITGLMSALTGGSGLMPDSFVGDGKGLYMPSKVMGKDEIGRELNPTSAILSAASMLRDLGYREEHDTVIEAVMEMYRIGHTTPDIGGKLNAAKFAKEIVKMVYKERQV